MFSKVTNTHFMHLTHITTAKKAGFRKSHLHTKKERPKQTVSYLKQKSSFFMAAVSLFAFVAGNMAGDHGWYAFWKAVVGNADDALITYNGTVTPVALVPDYSEWGMYGGDSEQHTFRQVPKDSLIPMPAYDQAAAKKGLDMTGVYSVGNMGSYQTGAENGGSHPGVDIRVPVGTPVRSIAAGIVTHVREDVGGFGYFIVIRHPHMPDPDNAKKETVLHSTYAHLSAQLVKEGDILEKGEQIGLSGQTGFATGPHLHFQVDRDEAPWHPYWPFTGAEARAAGLTTTQAINTGFHQERLKEYTEHPMLVVQSNRPAVTKDVATKPTTRKTREQSVLDRKNARLARTPQTTVAHGAAKSSKASVLPQSSSSAQAVVVTPDAIPSGTLAVAEPVQSASSSSSVASVASTATVASFQIDQPRQFTGREWVTVRITLLDETGRKTTSAGLGKDIYLRTAYGEAEFKNAVLRKEDFVNGVATVEMLPRGTRTVIILLQPYAFQGEPIEYTK